MKVTSIFILKRRSLLERSMYFIDLNLKNKIGTVMYINVEFKLLIFKDEIFIFDFERRSIEKNAYEIFQWQ